MPFINRLYPFVTVYNGVRPEPVNAPLQPAVPYGFEPGHIKPTPTGGHWHPNGGGWVDNRANVASTAYVGPMAAVYGNSTVTGALAAGASTTFGFIGSSGPTNHPPVPHRTPR